MTIVGSYEITVPRVSRPPSDVLEPGCIHLLRALRQPPQLGPDGVVGRACSGPRQSAMKGPIDATVKASVAAGLRRCFAGCLTLEGDPGEGIAWAEVVREVQHLGLEAHEPRFQSVARQVERMARWNGWRKAVCTSIRSAGRGSRRLSRAPRDRVGFTRPRPQSDAISRGA